MYEIMYELSANELNFIKKFSNSNCSKIQTYIKNEIQNSSNFLNIEIGKKYIGNILKNIDMRLYLIYLQMINDNIEFIDNFNVQKSLSVSYIGKSGMIKNVKVKVPKIKKGLDILVCMHELGHGIKSFTKIENERFLLEDFIYSETISILFGKVALDRYISDFKNDEQSIAFEIININNALRCLKDAKQVLDNLNDLYKKIESLDENDKKYQTDRYKLFQELYKVTQYLCELISYPIGLALANAYDNFDYNKKKEYLELITSYLLNINQMNFDLILDYFDISLNADYYITNFSEYINKFDNNVKKMGVLKNG